MMPKNLRMMYSAVWPRYLVSQCVPISTRYSTIIHSNNEMQRLPILYSAVMASNAVKAPGPAYIGKAKGTNELALLRSPSNLSFWKIVMSRIISSAMRKITKPPAIAKYSICTPNNRSIHSPKNRNAIRITRLATHTFSAWILMPFFSIAIVTGMFPNGSMMAIRNTNDDSTCQISNSPKNARIASIFY